MGYESRSLDSKFLNRAKLGLLLFIIPRTKNRSFNRNQGSAAITSPPSIYLSDDFVVVRSIMVPLPFLPNHHSLRRRNTTTATTTIRTSTTADAPCSPLPPPLSPRTGLVVAPAWRVDAKVFRVRDALNVLALWAKLGALDLVEHQEEHKRQRDQHRDAQADDALFPEIVPGAKRQEWQEDDGR